MDNAEGGGFFPSDWRVLIPVDFNLMRELHLQSVVGWGFCWLPGVWEASQEMGRRNHPSFLRNRLLPKLVHQALGVLGVSDSVPVDLENLDARDG